MFPNMGTFIRIISATMAARRGLSRFINLVILLSVSLVVWDRRCFVLLSWASGPQTSGGRHISSVFIFDFGRSRYYWSSSYAGYKFAGTLSLMTPIYHGATVNVIVVIFFFKLGIGV